MDPIALINDVCLREGISPPKVSWHWRSGKFSSGKVTEDGLTITAGTDLRDRQIVLLHELSHVIVGWKQHHSPAFWDKAFELYARYRLTKPALESERGYRKGAVDAHRRRRRRKPLLD